MLVKRLSVTDVASGGGEAAGLALLFLIPTVARRSPVARTVFLVCHGFRRRRAAPDCSPPASSGLPVAGQPAGGAYALMPALVSAVLGPAGIDDPPALASTRHPPRGTQSTTGPSTIVRPASGTGCSASTT
jgi:hypothetical protein